MTVERRVGSAGVSVDAVGDQAPAQRDVWRDPLLRRMLALADAGAVLAVSASIDIFGSGISGAVWSALFLPVWIIAAKLYGLYDRDHRTLRHLTTDELPTILVWGITCVAGLVLFMHVMPAPELGAATAVRALGVALVAALVARALARALWRHLTPPERTIVIGRPSLTHAIRRKLDLFSDIHAEVVAEWEEVGADRRAGRGWPAVDRIILATNTLDEELIAGLVSFCRRAHVKLSLVPPARGMFGTAVQLRHVADLPVIEYNTWDVSRSTLMIKRVLDVILASALLIAAAPLFVAIAIALWLLRGRGPIFFVQTRAGLHGEHFRMIKFRTMVADAEKVLSTLVEFEALHEPVFKLHRDPRVTRMGRFLRRTSLDELPQLLNVVKGDMSLVGPRPEQVELVERYHPDHRFRLAVRPGVTGPMQVFGRGRLSFEERLAVEREYIENLSISRDLRILALTIPSVFSGKGAY